MRSVVRTKHARTTSQDGQEKWAEYACNRLMDIGSNLDNISIRFNPESVEVMDSKTGNGWRLLRGR